MNIILAKENCAFSKGFQKDFKKLENNEQQLIKDRMQEIFDTPGKALLKKLTNCTYAQYRLRIGHFRLLFSVDKKNQKFLFSHCKKRKELY